MHFLKASKRLQSDDKYGPHVTLDLVMSEYENTGTILSFFSMVLVRFSSLRLINKAITQCIANYPWMDRWASNVVHNVKKTRYSLEDYSNIVNLDYWHKCFPSANCADLDFGKRFAQPPDAAKYLFGTQFVILGTRNSAGIQTGIFLHDSDMPWLRFAKYVKLINQSGISVQGLTKLDNVEILYLGSCVTSDLRGSSLAPLKNLKKLHIGNGILLDDASLEGLSHLRYLEIDPDHNPLFSDAGLQHLVSLETLLIYQHSPHFGNMHSITGSCFAHMVNLTVLNMVYRTDILDSSFAFLSNLLELDARHCTQVTDDCLKHLTRILKLNISHCTQVTDRGLSFLAGVQQLAMVGCSQDTISDRGLARLRGIQWLDMSHCTQSTITDASATFLAQVPDLCMYGCFQDSLTLANLFGVKAYCEGLRRNAVEYSEFQLA